MMIYNDQLKFEKMLNGDFDINHIMRRKRSYGEMLSDLSGFDETFERKSKYQITEDKMATALSNLHLSKNENEKEQDILNTDQSDEIFENSINEILLSDEIKASLSISKKNDDLDLIKKLVSKTNSINRDSSLQVVLWEPNRNITKIINCIKNEEKDKADDNDVKYTTSSQSNKIITDKEVLSSDYIVEEPVEQSLKRNLKRTYSQVNKLLIEEVEFSNEMDELESGETVADQYYFVEEPTKISVPNIVFKLNDNVNKQINDNLSSSNNTLNIEEVTSVESMDI